MPSDFDFEDVDLAAVPDKQSATAASEEVKAVVLPLLAQANLDSDTGTDIGAEEASEPMDELTRKMLKSQYYWELMQQTFFDEPDEVSEEVEAEIQGFLRSRVHELMGVSGPKKRGRKPAVQPVSSAPAPRLAPRPKLVPRKKAKVTKSEMPSTPTQSSYTGQDVVQEFTSPEGEKKIRVFKKLLDKETGREYYLGYDKTESGLVADGNKYYMATNAAGTKYFRVMSQQTLPLNVQNAIPMSPAAIEVQSQIHARQTLASVKKNSLLDAALGLALKS